MTLTMAKTDHQIQKAVLQELEWDTNVDETEVGVEVNNAVVTLTGMVSSYARKVAAQNAAHRVAGVLDVANDIQVKMPDAQTITDTEIAQAVCRALEWDALVAHENIRSTVSNGMVTLEGTVPFCADRSYAERAVRNLTGVRGVIDLLSVSSSQQVAPEKVRNSIEAALARRSEREADRIRVEVKDGTVFLTGKVHNSSEREAVLGAAGCAPGVRKVEDRLSVDPYF